MPARAQTAEELIESQHVMIRHRLEPAEPVYVGQPVRLWVEVMTRTWFLEAPRYPDTIEVRNAIVIPPDAFGVNATERIGGDTYAVQGRAYTVFPQRTGRFEVPPVVITLVVARDDASKSPPIELSTEPVTIEARLPSAAEGHGLVLSTPRLTVSEEYSRSLEGLEVGESFDRRVTLTIQDSVAMLLPPIEFEADSGIAVYPGRPDVSDQRNRGQLTGTRVDQASFVLEAEGTYQLPAISIWWWNLRTSQLVEEVLPGVELTVAPNPDLAAEHLGEPEMEEVAAPEVAAVEEEPAWGWREIGYLVLGLLATLFAARQLARWWDAGKQRRGTRDREKELFERFQRQAREGEPGPTYSALMSWLDGTSPKGTTSTARDFVEMSGDERLARQYDSLERVLFGAPGSSTWDAAAGTDFAKSVDRARKKWLADEADRKGAEDPLPPLNPIAP